MSGVVDVAPHVRYGSAPPRKRHGRPGRVAHRATDADTWSFIELTTALEPVERALL